jgi:hypothetical protein
MPTLVKEPVTAKPAAATQSNGLQVAVLLLAIAVAGGLLALVFPPPPEMIPAAGVMPAPDLNFFGP